MRLNLCRSLLLVILLVLVSYQFLTLSEILPYFKNDLDANFDIVVNANDNANNNANLDDTKNDNSQSTKQDDHHDEDEEEKGSQVQDSVIISSNDNDNDNNDTNTLPTLLSSNDTMTCFAWSPEADKWWGEHPEWEVTIEQDEQLCFTPVKDEAKAKFFHDLRQLQFDTSHPNCTNTTTYTKKMFSSGWGADLNNVASGLAHGYKTKQPFQINQNVLWHYTAKKAEFRKPNDKPVCESGDMFCYFLPLGACPPVEMNAIPNIQTGRPSGQIFDWSREYATRKQQWLRKEVYDYVKYKAPFVQTPCAAMHVRRADIVLHSKFARKYFPISSYVDKILKYDEEKSKKNNNNNTKTKQNFLLFTDDQNAIEEAHEFYPQHNWMYLNRTRHRGSSGGWENQIPSESPKDEVVALLSVFKLAQKCDALAYSKSGFATLIYNSMIETGREIKRLPVDENIQKMHHTHTASELELQASLDKLRANMTSTPSNATITTS